MGNLQAEKVGKLGKDVVNQYFGIFFLVFQSSGVWGNLISSLVFGKMSRQGKERGLNNFRHSQVSMGATYGPQFHLNACPSCEGRWSCASGDSWEAE